MIKIILVEDDVEMLEGLTHVIDWMAHGFNVVGTARNGVKALGLVEKTRPDVILTDITMPMMNGLELIRQAKKIQPGIKSIIISCHEEFEYAQEAIRLQADEYLLKHTLTDEVLIQTITKLKQNISDNVVQLQKQYGFESIDEQTANEQSYRISELAQLYEIYIPKLKKAVKELDTTSLINISDELLEFVGDKYKQSLLNTILSKILVELAMIMPDTRGINVEVLQLKDNITFKSAIQLIAEKIETSRYNTTNADILKAINYIEKNLSNNISCKNVSSHINMNSNYFSRLFKKEIGLSFSDFVLQKRIDKATELLFNTSHSIQEIVDMVGIESISYFYRTYKRLTGSTPGDRRKKSHNKSS